MKIPYSEVLSHFDKGAWKRFKTPKQTLRCQCWKGCLNHGNQNRSIVSSRVWVLTKGLENTQFRHYCVNIGRVVWNITDQALRCQCYIGWSGTIKWKYPIQKYCLISIRGPEKGLKPQSRHYGVNVGRVVWIMVTKTEVLSHLEYGSWLKDWKIPNSDTTVSILEGWSGKR